MDVNGQAAKPHREIRPGDVIEISRARGLRRQRVVVRATADQHIRKADARRLYEDQTPAPSPAEQELIDLMRLAGPRRRATPETTPDRRERRRLRGLKEGGAPD